MERIDISNNCIRMAKGISLIIFLVIGMQTLLPIVTETFLVQKSYAQNTTSNNDTNMNIIIDDIKNNMSKLQSQVEHLNIQVNLLMNSLDQLEDSNFATRGELDNAIASNYMQFSNALNQLGFNTKSNLDGVWNCIVSAANYASQNGGFYDFVYILNRSCQ
jgi:hypothetical protein